MKLTAKEMAKSITELKEAIKYLTLNSERLLEGNKKTMRLEQDIFHEKWKVRYLTRRLKAIDPNEAVTEEELDEQIHGKMN